MWLALAAAFFFGLIVLVTLLRAEKSVANGALTVITLLAIGIAAAATIRGTQPSQGTAAAVPAPVTTAALPALACLDDLAGEMVLAACEKVLFGSADAVAAAVSASAARISQLAGLGDVARVNATLTPDLAALRQAIEHDRYGLFAYVLQARDRCMPEACPFYAALTDHKQITANMDGHTYEGLVTRYASGWNAPAAAPQPVAGVAGNPALASNPALAGLPPSVPTGKPTTADFPSAASIPPVSIMNDTPPPPPKPAAGAQPPPHTAAKKQAPKARPQPAAPAEAAPLAPDGAEADKSGG